MDEEKRTSAQPGRLHRRGADRIIFVNTGFLDRTGDEIHTSMQAGPMVRKGDMKSASGSRPTRTATSTSALAAGFAGQAQIGKGMWAKPAAMAEMLEQKIAQPKAGANYGLGALADRGDPARACTTCASTSSPARRSWRGGTPSRADLLLTLPAGATAIWDEDESREELETNAQSILGYVVRWVGLGIGCSTVPDLDGVGLMEDRATLRISSQLIANWLEHGVVRPPCARLSRGWPRSWTSRTRTNPTTSRWRPTSTPASRSPAAATSSSSTSQGPTPPSRSCATAAASQGRAPLTRS